MLLNDSDNITKQYMTSTTFTVFYKQRNRQMELNGLTKEMLLIDGKNQDVNQNLLNHCLHEMRFLS